MIQFPAHYFGVITGLDPVIYLSAEKLRWIAGSSPAMTTE
jgi:hypothetical protein